MPLPHMPTHKPKQRHPCLILQWRTLPTTKCLRNGAVTCKFKVLSSFNVWFRGQDAASKAHHCANTNVASNCIKTMRTPKILFGLLFLTTFCQTETKDLNGYYVSDRYGYTIDIIDSLVLLNADNIFRDEHDTIIIDLKNNSFVRSSPRMFPFYDFKSSKDKVTLFFEHDAGTESLDFYKTKLRDRRKNFFSTSPLNIDLNDCDGSCYDIADQNIANILIGTPKNKEWGDSIKIQFEDVFISVTDIKKLNEGISDSTVVVCLFFDKNVPQSIQTQIINETKGLRNKIVKARLDSDRIRYLD
jgi:hypothetical protein